MTSSEQERISSLFMLVPGPWQSPHELACALRGQGIDVLVADASSLGAGELRVDIVEDDGLAQGFTRGRGGPLDSGLLEQIDRCTHAALIEFRGCLREGAAKLTKLGAALRTLGGVAIRMEASGAACSWETWLADFQSGELARIYARTVLVVGDESEMFTCGMQLFELPDAQIETDDPSESLRWLDALCKYQLEEGPALLSGHTFRPDADAERRVLERWPDPHHDTHDGRHNPFGQWRIQLPEVARVSAGELVATIIPSLTAQLIAAEDAKGKALSRREVESLTTNATAVAMEPGAARALERSRGYADIEPELAWEQWQVVCEMRE